MSDQARCVICGTDAQTLPSYFDGIHQKCLRCGEFKLTRTANSLLSSFLQVNQAHSAKVQTKISGWVCDQNRAGTIPTIGSDDLKIVSARSLPTVPERGDRLLLEALRGQKQLSDDFNIAEPRFLAATYSQDDHEVDYLADMLVDEGLVKRISGDGLYQILLRGHIAADKLTRRVTQSDKGFVAMSFDQDLKSAYEKGFQVGILNAGYDPVRVDRVEHVNRIDDEIIAQIRAASFVVADFTKHRGGVYFEAGFALGLDLPLIWTCRKDDMKGLHFDIRQYNTIDWEESEELATRLQHRIEATVGKGPKTVLDS